MLRFILIDLFQCAAPGFWGRSKSRALGSNLLPPNTWSVTLPTLPRTGRAARHFTNSTADWTWPCPSLYQLYHGLDVALPVTLPTLPRTGRGTVRHSTNSTTDWMWRCSSLYQLFHGLDVALSVTLPTLPRTREIKSNQTTLTFS